MIKNKETCILFENTYLLIKINNFDIGDIINIKSFFILKNETDYAFTTIHNKTQKIKRSNMLAEMNNVINHFNSIYKTDFQYNEFLKIFTYGE